MKYLAPFFLAIAGCSAVGPAPDAVRDRFDVQLGDTLYQVFEQKGLGMREHYFNPAVPASYWNGQAVLSACTPGFAGTMWWVRGSSTAIGARFDQGRVVEVLWGWNHFGESRRWERRALDDSDFSFISSDPPLHKAEVGEK